MSLTDYLRASNGSGESVRCIVVEARGVGDMVFNNTTPTNWNTYFIAMAGTVDPTTDRFIEGQYVVFKGHLDGSAITIEELAPGYTDIGNQEGDIIVIKPTTLWADIVAEALAAVEPGAPVEASNVTIDATGHIINTATDLQTYTDNEQTIIDGIQTAVTARELLANKDTDSTFAANSDTKYPSQKAVKTAVDGKQPLDSDLTTIAALDSSTAGALVTDGAGWIRKTYAQLKTALSLTKSDVGLSNVDNTSDAAKPVSTLQAAADAAVLAASQPLDSDLTTIAGLTPTTDNFMVANASAWASRTPSQARTHMGLGSVALLSTITEANITLADNTTNNFSTSAHGFVPKGTNVGKFLKDDGTWDSIPGGGDALTSNPLSQFAATTSLQLKNTISDETGSGALVFGTAPALSAPTGLVKGDVGLGNVDNTSDATKQAATLLAVFPIGSIYINTSNTNPGTFIGGTWTAFGAGRVPVGFDSGQTEFDTDEETGGAKTVTLTSAESGVPAHTHTLTSQVVSRGAGGTGANDTSTAGTRSIATASALANTPADAASAHNNLQPYIVVRMWKRTA